jgi:molybdenum cofactor biosynthesis protein B
VSDVPQSHRDASPQSVACAVVTVSDTRTLETDRGGETIVSRLEGAGHRVLLRQIIPDGPEPMEQLLAHLCDWEDVQAVLLTGGTGISGRDQTFETVSGMLSRQLPGYGELFRYLSFQQIGAAAMLSRTVGGVMDRTIVLTMPGSVKAVELAMQELILPELGHLVHEAEK